MSNSDPFLCHEYLPQILETMHGGLLLIHPSGRIMMVNRAMEKLTGYDRSDMTGQSCSIFQCDACEIIRRASPHHWCRLFEYPEKRREGIRCDIIHKNGSIIPVLKNAAVLRSVEGQILGAVETLIDLSDLQKRDRKIEELSRRLPTEERFAGMVGQSPVMRRTFDLIEKAARSEAPVIIFGESGTGKELVATAIHHLSERSEGPFVQLNCAALNESLLESELFGHVKGAFTGAYRHRTGRFEAADGGAIFLDEIGEMPPATQAKLLRVLENKQVERVGDHTPIGINVRIIAATNRDLKRMVADYQFRQDLFFRINVIPIHLPPLRERREDIPLLTDSIVRELTGRSGKRVSGISRDALERFMRYPWPGNVRELKSALEYAFVVAETPIIGVECLPGHIILPDGLDGLGGLEKGIGDPYPEARDGEKGALIAALRKTGGNRTQTAQILGVTRATVWNRIRKYKLEIKQVVAVSP